MTETVYGFLLNYANFAFSPSNSNVFLGLKAYSSTLSPFFYLQSVYIWTSSGTGSIQNFITGYSVTPSGIRYNASIIMFNSTQPCSTGQYLFYVQLLNSLPYSCISCDASCATCFPPNINNPSVTDSNSCLSCPYDRYMVLSNSVYGRCNCSAKLGEINGVCNGCEINCLTFQVVYI